jgi:polyisoprenyl-phosphate glycosyltransferase
MDDGSKLLRPVPLLSLVVPMFNEEDVVDIFMQRTLPILESITQNFEIVCVSDGSRDRTFAILCALNTRDPRIKAIDLSRNFGKELALTAGLDHTTGQAVVPIDVDLQDPPELIPAMVARWREGFDVVLAAREDRSDDSWAKRISASLFYRFAGRVGDVELPANVGDFRLMDRRVVDALKRLPERARFMKGLFAWLGFRQSRLTYRRPPRAAGTTKWRPLALWSLAIEGFVSFTTLPLKVWSYIGATCALGALGYMAYLLIRVWILGIDVPGYASVAVFVLFLGGLNLLGLGVLGEYVARIFLEVKQRPLYLVREAIGIAIERRP